MHGGYVHGVSARAAGCRLQWRVAALGGGAACNSSPSLQRLLCGASRAAAAAASAAAAAAAARPRRCICRRRLRRAPLRAARASPSSSAARAAARAPSDSAASRCRCATSASRRAVLSAAACGARTHVARLGILARAARQLGIYVGRLHTHLQLCGALGTPPLGLLQLLLHRGEQRAQTARLHRGVLLRLLLLRRLLLLLFHRLLLRCTGRLLSCARLYVGLGRRVEQLLRRGRSCRVDPALRALRAAARRCHPGLGAPSLGAASRRARLRLGRDLLGRDLLGRDLGREPVLLLAHVRVAVCLQDRPGRERPSSSVRREMIVVLFAIGRDCQAPDPLTHGIGELLGGGAALLLGIDAWAATFGSRRGALHVGRAPSRDGTRSKRAPRALCWHAGVYAN